MEQQALSLVWLIFGVMGGALATWFVIRSRVAAAYQNGEAAPQAELGALRERLRALEEVRQQQRI